MSLANPYQQYQQNAVQSSDPGQLTMMLLDGTVKFLILSINSLEQNNLNGVHNNLVRSQEIISYLNETLDHSYELSKNLSAIYDFMNRQLVDANIKKDLKTIQEVLYLAKDLRDTWQQVLKMTKEQR